MKRTSIKRCKGRTKALLGADGAIMAAATLASAAMNVGATMDSAKKQADAAIKNAETQAEQIKAQSDNNTNLQKESMAFSRQQNQENRQLQKDIQATLQMMAGQQNMNDIMEANKVAVKYGGRQKLKTIPFYGEADKPFKVTDGGGALPIATDYNGYGLYEIYGDNHEQSHKAPGGKRKTGVGFKFPNGAVVEGEGNGNSGQGELLYVTPNDALFISKHSIDGFNPAKAVKSGVHPVEAFEVQEYLKQVNGFNDDGSKKLYGGLAPMDIVASSDSYPMNSVEAVAGGAIKSKKNTSTPVGNIKAKSGARVSLKHNRDKAKWGDYAGAVYSGIGNVVGAGATMAGNMIAGNMLSNAYNQAGQTLADAYNSLETIDESFVNKQDYAPAHAMATVRSANTNISPQLERLRRNAASERTAVNRGTISSAARQQRLAETNDRLHQRTGELYATKLQQDERIKQANAQSITEVSALNAQLDAKANEQYARDRLSLKQYNNNIENQKIAGAAQVKADALFNSTSAQSQALTNSMAALAGATTATASGFSSAIDAVNKADSDLNKILPFMDTENLVTYLEGNPNVIGNAERAQNYYNSWIKDESPILQGYAKRLAGIYKNIKI